MKNKEKINEEGRNHHLEEGDKEKAIQYHEVNQERLQKVILRKKIRTKSTEEIYIEICLKKTNKDQKNTERNTKNMS